MKTVHQALESIRNVEFHWYRLIFILAALFSMTTPVLAASSKAPVAGPDGRLQASSALIDNSMHVAVSDIQQCTTNNCMFSGSMEGSLPIPPSTWFSAGYIFQVTTGSSPATVYFANASVTIPVACGSANNAVVGNIVINFPSGPFIIPANFSGKYPTGDQNSYLSYEGATQTPDLCAGQPMYSASQTGGAIYAATIESDQSLTLDVQFHYRSPAAKGKADVNCSDPTQNVPGHEVADICGASWSSTQHPPTCLLPDLGVYITDHVVNVTPGQPLTYVVPYTNTGYVKTTGTMVTVSVPPTITNIVVGQGGVFANGIITWNMGSFPVGASGTFTFTANVIPTAPPGTYTAIAHIFDDGAHGVDPTPPDNVAIDTDIIQAVPDLGVYITDGQTLVNPGQALTYNVPFTNTGNVGVNGTLITVTLPPTLTNIVPGQYGVYANGTIIYTIPGTFAVGASSVVTFTANVIPTAPPGSFTAIAQIGLPGNDGTPVDNISTDTDFIQAVPDLGVYITDGQTLVNPGQALTYSVSYTNTGNVGVNGTLITVTLPPTLTNIVPGQYGVYANGTIIYTIPGTFAAGTSSVVTFTANVIPTAPPGSFTAIAQIGLPGNDGTPVDNISTDTDFIQAVPDLGVYITDGQTLVNPGQALTYSVSYTNTGNVGVNGTLITVTLPPTLTNIVPGQYGVYANGNIIYTIPDAFAAGASSVVTFTANVIPTAPPGSFTAIAQIGLPGNDGTPVDNISTDTDIIQAIPDLGVSITDNVDYVKASDPLTYFVPYTNTGYFTATGTVVTVSVPPTITNIVPGQNGTFANGVITWYIGTVAGQSTGLLTFTASVSPTAPPGPYTALAYIHDDHNYGPDVTPPDNSARDIDIIVTIPTGIDFVYFQVKVVSVRNVMLEWSPANIVSCSAFNIYRTSGSGGFDPSTAVKVHTEAVNIFDAGYSYTDVAPGAGSWTYWLTCVNSSGNESTTDLESAPVVITIHSYFFPLLNR